MPRIPTYDLPEIGLEAPPQPTASPEAFGAGVARSVQGLGQQIERSANVFQEHVLRFQREQNENAAFEAESQFSMKAAELETQFMMLEGNQQAASYADFQKQLQGLRDETLRSATNDYTRRLVERATADRFENVLTTASRSAALKNRDYMVKSAEARIEWETQNAASGDDERFGLAIGNAERNVDWLAGVAGWDATTTALKKREAVSTAVLNRAAMMARTDPFAARDLVAKMGNEMLPEHRLQLDGAIRNEIATTQVKKDQQAFLEGQVPGVNGNFREVLGARESAGSGGYTAKNTLGYVGKYQFGTARAKDIGIYSVNDNNAWGGTFKIPGHPEVKTLQDFLNNPAAQEVAFDIHEKKMEREIKENGFGKYEGQVVDGVVVTRNGIKAALHLGGVGGTRKFLEGRGSEEDKYGTGVKDYMRLGGGATSETLPKVTPETSDAEFNIIIEAARRHARTVARDIPEYEERLVAGLTNDRNLMQTQATEQLAARYSSLGSLILNNNLTEIPAEYMDEYNALPFEKQRSLNGVLEKNSKPANKVITPEQRTNYYELLGKRADGTLTTDDVLKTDLHVLDQRKLMEELTKAPSESSTGLDNTEALGDISYITNSVFPDKETSKIQAKNFRIFSGRYLSILEAEQARTGKPPDDKFKRETAAKLVAEVGTGQKNRFSRGEIKGPAYKTASAEQRRAIRTALIQKRLSTGLIQDPTDEEIDAKWQEYLESNQ